MTVCSPPSPGSQFSSVSYITVSYQLVEGCPEGVEVDRYRRLC